MDAHHISVARSARYFTLGVADSPAQVWFVCHGYGQLANAFLSHCGVLDDGTRRIVAPEGLSRFYRAGTNGEIGASWMTREERETEIADYVSYLDAIYTHTFEHLDRDAVDVFVLGFSQGAATACRWIVNGAGHAEHLVVWGEFIPTELHSREGHRHLRAIDLHLVYGARDEYINADRRAEQRQHLEAHGVDAHEWSFAGGHRLDDDTLLGIAEGRTP